MPPSGSPQWFAVLDNKSHSPLINIPIIMLILTFALEVDLLPQECTETINLITFLSLSEHYSLLLDAVGNNNALMTLHSIYFSLPLFIYVYAVIITLLLLHIDFIKVGH